MNVWILNERPSWGKTQGNRPLHQNPEGGGYRENPDRPADTPGRGLRWPASIQAAWRAAETAGMQINQFATAVSKTSGGMVSTTMVLSYVAGRRSPATYACREGIRRALNFTDTELPSEHRHNATNQELYSGFPNKADLLWRQLLYKAGAAFWPEGPHHAEPQTERYRRLAEKKLPLGEVCPKSGDIQTDNMGFDERSR